MRAIQKFADGKDGMGIREVPEPVVGPEDVLIDCKYVGLCGSDLNAFRGAFSLVSLPVIPGHEFVGRVVALGAPLVYALVVHLVGVFAQLVAVAEVVGQNEDDVRCSQRRVSRQASAPERNQKQSCQGGDAPPRRFDRQSAEALRRHEDRRLRDLQDRIWSVYPPAMKNRPDVI